MKTDGTEPQDSIAQELGWESYQAAPHIVQNNIDSVIEGPLVEDPFAQFRRGE